MTRLNLPELYAILDVNTAIKHHWKPLELARAYLAGGAKLLQVRSERVGSAGFLDLCDAMVEEGHRSEAMVIANDRVDVAVLSGSDGVHVGQSDLPVTAVRFVIGARSIVGLSTHTTEQVDAALQETVSYIAVGPVFSTSTKLTNDKPVGLELVRYAARRADGIPIVAIGGITLDSAPGVINAGASSVAVVSDLLVGGDPEGRVRDYIAALERELAYHYKCEALSAWKKS